MITNQRQYAISQGELRRFEEALAEALSREPSPDVDPAIHRAMQQSLVSEIEELQGQIDRYEGLRDGKIRNRVLRSLREVPYALVEARIAANLTQKDLAIRVGLAEQQIQRYESSAYTGVALERLQDLADALEVNLNLTIAFRQTTYDEGPADHRLSLEVDR